MLKHLSIIVLAILAGCTWQTPPQESMRDWKNMIVNDDISFEYPSNAEISKNEIKYTTMNYYEIRGSHMIGTRFNVELARPQTKDEYFFELRLYSDKSYLECDKSFLQEIDHQSQQPPSKTGRFSIGGHQAYYRIYDEMNSTGFCANTNRWGIFGFAVSPSEEMRMQWIRSVRVSE